MDLHAAADPVADPAVQRLLEDARPRLERGLDRRERVTEVVAATAFVAAAAVVAAALPDGRELELPLALALTGAYAFASRVRFYVGAGYTIPTQLIFVPMLFLLPLTSVPALVAIGLTLGKLPDVARRRLHPERALTTSVSDAWHSLGPVAVLGLAGADGPAAGDAALYLAALAAQVATDLVVSTARERFALGIAAPLQLRVLGWVYAVDVLLSPVGLLVAFAAEERPYAALLVLPLHVLLAVFAREREARISSALELGHAYRGTAMLLGDVIEGTDEYTGQHSRGVVSRALEVADELGLDGRQRRNVEFAALLHDIGKISIPRRILHKPGPLDATEWRVMRSHTVEGHRMLAIVGGVLDDVGRIVRATHERWDGRGYPDGLAGRAIPIEACIVAACDSFDAMTTDRVYRRAMSVDAALVELHQHAGKQFHPEVVEALVAIVERDRASEAGRVELPPLVRPTVATTRQT